MGAEGRGLPGGRRCVPQHRPRVVGAFAVVGQHRRVSVRPVGFGQHGQPPHVQVDLPVGRDRVHHRQPQQLMPEPQGPPVGDQDAGGQAVLDGGHDLEHRRQLGWADPGPGYGGGFHGPADAGCRPAQPGAGRVPDRRRDVRAARRKHLADVERVPPGDPEQLVRVHVPGPGQRPDRTGRQRRQPHAPDPALGGQVAQHDAQRMVLAQLVVPERGQHQHPHPGHPPPQQAEQVDRGLVGPVQVLQHDHGEPVLAVQLGQGGREQAVPGGALVAQPGQLSAGLGRDVKQRAQRTRRQQPIAGPPQPPAGASPVWASQIWPAPAPAVCLAERLDQGGLADTGLARDQDQPPVTLPRAGRLAR